MTEAWLGTHGKSGDPHGQGTKQGGAQQVTDNLGYRTVLEAPDYLLNPQSKVSYTYDAVGNRLSMTGDDGTTTYSYDAANRMLTAGDSSYTYDDTGNLTSKTDGTGTTQYEYNAAGKMIRVSNGDGTDVRYAYDGLGRNVDRIETYWQKPGPSETGLEHGQGFTQGQRKGVGNGKGQGQGQNALKLRSEETAYLYDGLQVFQEFTGEGSPLAEYMRGNDLVASRQTFGFHGRKDEGREGNLRTRGGLLYYGYDGLGSVTDLTDRTGAEVMQYRYDAFGGLYTGITSPYNTVGFTGKSYDPKASLVQFYSRWYDPSVGRFTTQDSYLGELVAPASQHRYAYVLNNPVTKIDPWGYHDPGDPGGTFSSWYSYEPEYAYTNEQTVTDSSTDRSGAYLITTTVTTVYADKYKVVYKYYNDSDGAHELVSESAPQYLGRVVESRSTSQTSVYSPLPPTGGDPNDGKPNDGNPSDGNPSDGNPSDGNPSNGNPGGGGGGYTETPAQRAARMRQEALEAEQNAGEQWSDDSHTFAPAQQNSTDTSTYDSLYNSFRATGYFTGALGFFSAIGEGQGLKAVGNLVGAVGNGFGLTGASAAASQLTSDVLGLASDAMPALRGSGAFMFKGAFGAVGKGLGFVGGALSIAQGVTEMIQIASGHNPSAQSLISAQGASAALKVISGALTIAAVVAAPTGVGALALGALAVTAGLAATAIDVVETKP